MDTHVTLTLPVLSKGVESETGTVFRLQQILNVFVGHGEKGSGIRPLKTDGVFGPKTEQKVKDFQQFGAEGAPGSTRREVPPRPTESRDRVGARQGLP